MIKKYLLPFYVVFNILFVLISSYLYTVKELKYYNFSRNYIYLLILNVIVLIVLYIFKIKRHEKLNFGSLDAFVLLLLIFGGISVIFAIKPHVALYGMPGRYEGYLMILYYFSVFMLSTYVKDKYKKIIIYFILFSGLIELIYAIMQVKNIHWVVKTYNYGKIWATGLTTNPNFFSTLMLLCLCYSIGLYFDSKKTEIKIIYLLFTFLFMIGLLIGNSMSGVAGLIVSLLYLLVYSIKRKVFVKLLLVLLIIFTSTFMIYKLNMTSLIKDFNKTTTETKEIVKGNIDENYGTKRLFIWKNTLKIVPKNIWTGVGIDNFYYAFGDKPLWKGKYFYDKAHNEYLQVLITQGIFALISYLCFYFILVYNGIKESYRINRVYLILPVIGFLTQAFFNFSVIEVAPFCFIALGLCVSRDKLGGLDEKGKCSYSSS